MDKAQEPFSTNELVFLGDFNAYHTSWLGSSKTDNVGRTAYAPSYLVGTPTIRISDVTS